MEAHGFSYGLSTRICISVLVIVLFSSFFMLAERKYGYGAIQLQFLEYVYFSLRKYESTSFKILWTEVGLGN